MKQSTNDIRKRACRRKAEFRCLLCTDEATRRSETYRDKGGEQINIKRKKRDNRQESRTLGVDDIISKAKASRLCCPKPLRGPCHPICHLPALPVDSGILRLEFHTLHGLQLHVGGSEPIRFTYNTYIFIVQYCGHLLLVRLELPVHVTRTITRTR